MLLASTAGVLASLSVSAQDDTREGAPAFAARNSSFDVERFVDDCRVANGQGGQEAVRDILARGVSDHAGVLAALGEPTEAGMNVLLRSPELTIFAATWTPQMNLVPHNHLMWALIGIYTGREDNIYWRETPDRMEAYAAEVLFAGDVGVLPADVIHSVTNPLQRFTGGLHIYGGDFFATPRSQWNAETLAQERSDGDVIRAMFARENERLRARGDL
jgi:predicted metal-dependent enzyme (double-stranded beta helix superfamily)